MTVSPGENSGTVLPRRAISSCSSVSMIFICVCSINVMAGGLVRSADRHLLRTLCCRSPAMLPLFFPFVRLICELAQVFLEQTRLVFTHPSRREQVRAPQPSPPQPLLVSPEPGRRLVPAQQHRRHGVAFVGLRPRVVWAIEQAI